MPPEFFDNRHPAMDISNGRPIKRILIVKVTSLGDVVHTQPIVADLQRAFPSVKIDWVVDEEFSEILHWNQGIDRVLCAPLRRFKKTRSWADFKIILKLLSELRSHRYDVVIDIHGVYKSAIIAFLAHSSRRFGYQTQDLGERGAAFAYTDLFRRRSDYNACDGMRITVSEAFGYRLKGPPVYNMQVPLAVMTWIDTDTMPVAVLFHATSRDEKKWPVTHWISVGRELRVRGFNVLLPWGSSVEYAQAVCIAEQIPDAMVLPQMTITELAQVINVSSLVVGVDTGFVHLAHALQKRTVMIFVTTSPAEFGINASFRSVSIGNDPHPATVSEVLQAIDYVYRKNAEFG